MVMPSRWATVLFKRGATTRMDAAAMPLPWRSMALACLPSFCKKFWQPTVLSPAHPPPVSTLLWLAIGGERGWWPSVSAPSSAGRPCHRDDTARVGRMFGLWPMAHRWLRLAAKFDAPVPLGRIWRNHWQLSAVMGGTLWIGNLGAAAHDRPNPGGRGYCL